VDVADGVPLDRQETALEDADLVTRERVLAVLATLEAAPSKAPAGGSVVPVSSGSTLDRPTDAARHVALWNYAVRWVRMGLGGAEVRTFVEHLAERWGLFAEGRGGEVENIVRGAMLKAKPSGFEGGGASVELRELDLKACLAEVSEPIPWALRVWLARRDAVTLGAEPKVGKSWLALALTVSGAAGRPWLGVVPIEGEPLRVVYVDEEQSPALVRYRIRRLAHGLGLSADDMAALPIRYLCGSGLNLDRPGDRDALFRAVEAHRADLVVFDALVRFHRREENSAGAMAALYDEAVKPLSRQFGAASLVLHHLTKPHKEQSPELVHRLRGSGDLVAAVDQLWTAERGDGGRVALRHERSRWTETAPPLVVAIEDTADGLGVTVTASTVANAAEEAILGVLRDAGTAGALRSDLVAAVEAAGFKAADRITTKHLGRLTAEKRIAKAVERRAVRYWLADMAPRRLVDDEGTD
jgi:hypothetical protein